MFWRTLIFLLVFPSFVLAQTPIKTVPEGEDKITPLPKGERAPYSGQLFSPDTALRWGNWIQQYRLRLKWESEYQKRTCDAEKSFLNKKLKLKEQAHDELMKDLRGRVIRLEQMNVKLKYELENPAWYNTRTFGVVLGVASTVLIFGLSLWAYHEFR